MNALLLTATKNLAREMMLNQGLTTRYRDAATGESHVRTVFDNLFHHLVDRNFTPFPKSLGVRVVAIETAQWAALRKNHTNRIPGPSTIPPLSMEWMRPVMGVSLERLMFCSFGCCTLAAN